MSKKNCPLILLLVAVMLMTTVAVSAAAETSQYPKVTIQVSFGNNAQDAQGLGAYEWKRLVEEQNVNVTVEVFPSNQLGANADLME